MAGPAHDARRRIEASPDLPLEPARSGGWTVKIDNAHGASVYLHSRHAPRAEAARQVEDLVLGPLDTVVLIGVGLGYLLAEILTRLGPENALIVIERDAALLKAASRILSIESLFERRNTHVLAGAEPADLYRVLTDGMPHFLASRIRLVPHRPSVQAFESYYHPFLRAIDDFVRNGTVLVGTTLHLSQVSFRNRMRNIPLYVESPGLLPLRGRFAGTPGVVVSAGPSLDKNIDELQGLKGRAVIIAVSTSLRVLLSRGIVPDFTTVVDYNRVSARYFEGVGEHRIPLVCDHGANWRAVSAYKGPKLFGDDPVLNALLDGAGGRKGHVPCGSTVAHRAFALAEYLGCDPIILVGQDLAYPEGRLHVAGTAVFSQQLPQFNRFYTFEMKEMEYYLVNRPALRKVPAVGGGEVWTCEVFYTYLREFEKMFRRYPGTVIDATEGGARKEGVIEMPLGEAKARYAGGRIPPEALRIDETVEGIPAEERLGRALGALERRIEEARELDRIYRRILLQIRKVIRETDRGRDADRIVLRILEARQKIRRHEILFHLLNQIAQSDLFLRVREDRSIQSSQDEGVSRQSRQARRDLAYVNALHKALGILTKEMEAAAAELARRVHEPVP